MSPKTLVHLEVDAHDLSLLAIALSEFEERAAATHQALHEIHASQLRERIADAALKALKSSLYAQMAADDGPKAIS